MAFKVSRASDLSTIFWKNGHRRFGYTPRGVRDEVRMDDEGNVHYYLWGNNIASHYKKRNVLVVRDTGWKTPTTKERLNNVLQEQGLGYISQEKGKWFIVRDKKKFEWSSGDNIFDLSNPEKHLTPFRVEKFKKEVKASAKLRKVFIEPIIKEAKADKFSDDNYMFMRALLSKRGYRYPDIFMDKPSDNISAFRYALNWYVRQPQLVKDEIKEMMA